jgi:hypothetical protein
VPMVRMRRPVPMVGMRPVPMVRMLSSRLDVRALETTGEKKRSTGKQDKPHRLALPPPAVPRRPSC